MYRIRVIVDERTKDYETDHIVKARVYGRRLFEKLCREYPAYSHIEVLVLETHTRGTLQVVHSFENECARQAHDTGRRGYRRK